MAKVLITNPKLTCHARSTSLPSRPHPLNAAVQEQLHILKGRSATEPSSAAASSICRNLCALRGLYESVNDSFQLPLTKQTISQEVLDGSLRLLDVCGTTRDILADIKESIQVLHSSFRRRSGGESGPSDEVRAYMNSRKKIKKMVSKCNLNLKTLEKICSPELSDIGSSLSPMFKEVEAASILVLKSLLGYASGTKTAPKQNGWKLVSEFLQRKQVSCDIDEEAEGNEVEKIDDILHALSSQKFNKTNHKTVLLKSALTQLQAAETTLHELEDCLEPIFRCLLKTRVCLLNAVNNY